MAVIKGTGKNKELYKIGDIPICETNYVVIKYNAEEYARLVRLQLKTNLPVSKLVALSSQPCAVCGNDFIQITIPLGLLSVKKQLGGSRKKKTDGKQAQGTRTDTAPDQ